MRGYLTLTQPYMLNSTKCGLRLQMTRYRPGSLKERHGDRVPRPPRRTALPQAYSPSRRSERSPDLNRRHPQAERPALQTATWCGTMFVPVAPATPTVNVTVPPAGTTVVRGTRLNCAFAEASCSSIPGPTGPKLPRVGFPNWTLGLSSGPAMTAAGNTTANARRSKPPHTAKRVRLAILSPPWSGHRDAAPRCPEAMPRDPRGQREREETRPRRAGFDARSEEIYLLAA